MHASSFAARFLSAYQRSTDPGLQSSDPELAAESGALASKLAERGLFNQLFNEPGEVQMAAMAITKQIQVEGITSVTCTLLPGCGCEQLCAANSFLEVEAANGSISTELFHASVYRFPCPYDGDLLPLLTGSQAEVGA